MAIYICDKCNNYKDDDFDPCEDNPNDPTTCLCPDCAVDIQEQASINFIDQRLREAGL